MSSGAWVAQPEHTRPLLVGSQPSPAAAHSAGGGVLDTP